MEKMRKEIQSRLKQKSALLGCLLILQGVVAGGIFPVELAEENRSGFIQGFQVGLLMAGIILVLVQVIRYQKALKDDAKLRQLYYKEHDERQCYIQQKVGKAGMEITVPLMLIAAVIAGYFSFEIFVTLLAATLLQALVQLGLKAYYSHTMSGEEGVE